MERNRFSKTIPTELGKLNGLLDLFLDYNNLSGSIPTNLRSLSLLEKVNLSFNDLTGTVSGICGLANLFKLEADCQEVDCLCCTECY